MAIAISMGPKAAWSQASENVGQKSVTTVSPPTGSRPAVPKTRPASFGFINLIGHTLQYSYERLEPPTDEEINFTLKHRRKNRELPSLAQQGEYRIVTEFIGESSDPPRFIPLIGLSVLRHYYYKCAVYEKDSDVPLHLEYIDHNCFLIAE